MYPEGHWGQVQHISEWIDRLLGRAEKNPAVMVHIDTNDKVRG